MRCPFPERHKSHDRLRDPVPTAISTVIHSFSRQSLKSPYSIIRYFQQWDSNWEASSSQSCDAVGQSSAERTSHKVSLLRIVLQKISLKYVSGCKFPHVCKSGYTVHSVTFGPNPSPTHLARIFSQIILFAIIILYRPKLSRIHYSQTKNIS